VPDDGDVDAPEPPLAWAFVAWAIDRDPRGAGPSPRVKRAIDAAIDAGRETTRVKKRALDHDVRACVRALI
jgi:hypothetical protein